MNNGTINFEISQKTRTILFLFLLETENKLLFQKAYKALTFYPGKSKEISHDPRKCSSRVFAKTMRRSSYE